MAFFTMLAVSSAMSSNAEKDDPPTPPPEKITLKTDTPPEDIVRKRFLLAYQTAETADRKVEAVQMLQGAKEIETLRLLSGMLADRNEIVRSTACHVMSTVSDPAGYLVKPLMGTLNDASKAVRIAAAEALSKATIRADAIKALSFALMTLAGQKNRDGDSIQMLQAYDRALENLTGLKCKERDPRGISSFWMDYWKQHGDEVSAEDQKLAPKETPQNREGLTPDSFDKK